jgi:hypothetical protein
MKWNGRSYRPSNQISIKKRDFNYEEALRPLGQKMHDTFWVANVQKDAIPSPPVSPTQTPTNSPTPTSTPPPVNCTWSATTAQWNYNTNEWDECLPVPQITPTQTPTISLTPSISSTPQVTPTTTITPSPSQPGTGGYIDYFDAAFYDGDGYWDSLTTNKSFRLINSPTYISDFSGMISFDGVNDYGVSDAQIIPNTAAWSIEFWYRFNSASCSYSVNRMFTDGRLGSSNTSNFIDARDCFGNARWEFDGIADAPGIGYGVAVPAQVVYTYSGGTVEVFLNGVNKYSDSGYAYTWDVNRLNMLTTNDVNKCAVDFSIIKTYGFKLTSTEVLNNFNQLKARFGL